MRKKGESQEEEGSEALNQAILDLYEELDWAGIDIGKVDVNIDQESGRVDVNVKTDSAPPSPQMQTR